MLPHLEPLLRSKEYHPLGQQFVQKVLSLLLLTEIVLSPLSDEALKVVGVLLHPDHHALQHQPHGVDAAEVSLVINN